MSSKETWLHLPRPGSQTREADRRSGENAGTHFRHRHVHGLQRRLRGAEEGRQPSRAVSGGPPALEQAAGDLSNHIVSCQIPADAAVRVVPRHRRHKLSRAAPRPTVSTARAPKRPPSPRQPCHAPLTLPPHLPFSSVWSSLPRACSPQGFLHGSRRSRPRSHCRAPATSDPGPRPFRSRQRGSGRLRPSWGRASGSGLDLFRFERSSPWSEGVFGSPETWRINNHQPGGVRDFSPSGRNTRSKTPESLTMGERGLPTAAVTGMSAT